MNYYEHHIGDYAQATSHLSFIEDAAYSRLIRKYYAEEKNLPADVKSVQRLVGARTKEEREAVANILDEFFTLESDGWHNKRCDVEIEKFQSKRVKAVASAQARWDKRKPEVMRTHEENNANASDGNDANAMRTQCEGSAPRAYSIPQTPDTRLHTPDGKPKPPGKPTPPKPRKGSKVTFGEWIAEIRASGQKPITGWAPIWAYAEKVGIPSEWILVAWHKFADRYGKDPNHATKKYVDWRRTFLNAVEGNWFKLWYAKDGVFALTTVGAQADLSTLEPTT